jgi:hypothetical protein
MTDVHDSAAKFTEGSWKEELAKPALTQARSNKLIDPLIWAVHTYGVQRWMLEGLCANRSR